jgi:hypothetical protein
LIQKRISYKSAGQVMTKPPGENSTFHRFTSFALSSWFFFFLVFSQPHRVHHLFDHEHPDAHEPAAAAPGYSNGAGHGAEHDSSGQPPCSIQFVAKNCPATGIEFVKLPFIDSAPLICRAALNHGPRDSQRSSSLQRAPPAIRL